MDFDFTRNYRITDDARLQLAKPIGALLEGTIEENIINASKWFQQNVSEQDFHIITVGDVVSEGLLESDNLRDNIKMMVIDGKTKRKKFQGKINTNTGDFSNQTIKSLPGCINGDSVSILDKLLQDNERYEVVVEGEEDLLALPLILLSDKNHYIIYGQPPITDAGTNIPAGMVIIQATDEVKKKIREILLLFESI